MTNIAVIVAISLWTNCTVNLHPSGEEKVVCSVVYERHETAYMIGTNRVVMATNIPIYTNLTRMVWKAEPLKLPRKPLSIPDFPMPPK